MKYLLVLLFVPFILISQPKWEKLDGINLKKYPYIRQVRIVNNNIAIFTEYIHDSTHFGQTVILFSDDYGKTFFEKIIIDTVKSADGTVIKPPVAYAFTYPDTNLCMVASSKEGIFYKSTDNLKTFTKIENNGFKDVLDLCFIDKNIGFLSEIKQVNPKSILLNFWRTKDGGNNWIEMSIPYTDTLEFDKIYPFFNRDSNEIYAYQRKKVYKSNDPDRFFKSIDSGLTWINWLNYPILDPPMIGPYRISSNLLYYTGDRFYNQNMNEYYKEIYKSVDDGLNIYKVFETLEEPHSSLIAVHFCNLLNGVAYTPYHIYRTTDGGEKWFKDSTFNYKDMAEPIEMLMILTPDIVLYLGEYNIYRIDYSKTGSTITDNAKEIKINEIINTDFIDLSRIDLLFNKEYLQYSIYDYIGKKLSEGKIQNNRIELNHLLNGTYILLINDEKEKYYSKFLLDKK